MLYDFLRKKQNEILTLTKKKSLELAGNRPSSEQLERGLPIFYAQLLGVLHSQVFNVVPVPVQDKDAMVTAAVHSDEEAMAKASGHPEEVEMAREAGSHGRELLRLGYTLSHVVHAYGAMCQSITELASKNNIMVTANEFHNLNRCLDIAIAGAVTEFHTRQNTKVASDEVERLGFLAHELRNALSGAVTAYQLIKRGTVGIAGKTGQILETSLRRLETLIDRSLTEVRLRVEPELRIDSIHLLNLVDQIVSSTDDVFRSSHQTLDIQIDPNLEMEADQQLFHSALSNLIQNARKFTRDGGHIQIRGKLVEEKIIIEVEDECGGLAPGASMELFKPFEQQNENREGLGLGLTIAQRAISLSHGSIELTNLPGKGCIFRIILARKANAGKIAEVVAA